MSIKFKVQFAIFKGVPQCFFK
ncbi:hypothetical protein EMIT0194P_110182 [Pseudomonas serbica]